MNHPTAPTDDPGSVWVRRVHSPLLLVLPVAGLLVEWRRSSRPAGGPRGRRPPLAVRAAAAIAVAGWLGSVRVVAGADGLAVGFGPWGWPQRRIPISRIRAAEVESGPAGGDGPADRLGRLARRLSVGIGYRFVPGGTRLVLGFGDVLLVRLDTGRTFGVSVPDARRAAAVLRSAVAGGDARDAGPA